MKPLSKNLRLGLEDLLGDLWHARRSGDLGRLALLSYFEVRRWARLSGEQGLVQHSSALVSGFPYDGRDSFLVEADGLIEHLERILSSDGAAHAAGADPSAPCWRRGGGSKLPGGPAAAGA